MSRGPHRRAHHVHTVRSRLTLLAAVIVAATLVVTGALLVFANQRMLTRAVEESLVQRADNVEADVARAKTGAILPSEGDPEDTFSQVVDGDGLVVASSANIASLPAVTGPPALGSERLFRTISAPTVSSQRFRIFVQRVASTDRARTLIVAKNLDDVTESVGILITSLMVSIPLVVCLLAGAVWWLMGRALSPVEAIRVEVSSMGGAELHRRVPVSEHHDEISQLARTMNALLERVERATDRQREFVADASHELRGPLTRMRSELEVSIARPEGSDRDVTYRSVLNDTAQLQQLVEDLLFLARSESGRVEVHDTAVDLDDLVLEQVRELCARAVVRVDAGRVSAARVRGDAHQLKRVIGNLASNAERHAATTITFELFERDGRSELVVADDGPGIPVEQREAVFQRFTRLDDARSREAGGAGLGLAIVHDIVARHGGSISVNASEAGGARMSVTLPRAD
jgi:signal transduction histidine kinase